MSVLHQLSPSRPDRTPDFLNLQYQNLRDVYALNDAQAKVTRCGEDSVDPFHAQERLLVVSPYRTRSHLLDLSSVDTKDRLLALALAELRATRPDYATATYAESFNWSTVVERVRQLAKAEGYCWPSSSFYLITFRSQSNPGADRVHLGNLDEQAHEEAMGSGGLLKYWFGQPDPELRNLATCIWTGRPDALRANSGPEHRRAMTALREMYCTCELERYELTITDNVDEWSLVPWKS